MKLLSACALALVLVGGSATLALAQETDAGAEPADVIVGQAVAGFGTDIWSLLCFAPSVQAVVSVADAGGIDGRRFHFCVVDGSGVPGSCASTPDGGVATV